MRRRRAAGPAVALTVLLAACTSSSGGKPSTAGPAATTTTTVPGVVTGSFTLGSVDLQAVNAAADLPAATRDGVKAVLDRYLNTAVILPLNDAAPAGDLSAIFAGPALERVNGPDRAALVDEGLPKAAPVRVGTAHADLTALIGPDGIAALTAAIKVVVNGAVDGSPLTVERTGELLLAEDGGNWRVTGYDVKVTRDAAGAVTTTTLTTSTVHR